MLFTSLNFRFLNFTKGSWAWGFFSLLSNHSNRYIRINSCMTKRDAKSVYLNSSRSPMKKLLKLLLRLMALPSSAMLILPKIWNKISQWRPPPWEHNRKDKVTDQVQLGLLVKIIHETNGNITYAFYLLNDDILLLLSHNWKLDFQTLPWQKKFMAWCFDPSRVFLEG